MNRNSQNHFRSIPDIDIKRSKFNRPFTHKTTFDSGKLIPFYVDEILAGDTVQMRTAGAVRMATPIFPVMDNSWLDTYWFYVPFRLLWTHYPEFMGENKLTAWEQPIDYEIPQIAAPEGGWEEHTIADYIGVPTKVDGFTMSALYFRAYCMIWNEWFRDQNLKDAAMINLDETTVTGSNSGDYVSNAQLGAEPLPVARLYSYFSSALPEPQKGPDVLLPIGNIAGQLPVVGNGMTLGLYGTNAIHATATTFGAVNIASADNAIGGIYNRAGTNAGTNNTNGNTDQTAITSNIGISTDPELSGMVALAQGVSGVNSTINALRQAFAVQRLYERDARGGTRFREIMRAHFGVTTPDARVQIPEYLGGSRQRVNIDQVIQTSSTDATSPQGNASAYSLTNFVENSFTKSFVEPGILMGVMCIRADETYQQGLERIFTRKSRFDFYWPALANIGEQPVYNKEIYLQGKPEDEEVFGYQEAWADYRYKPSRVSGAFRSNYQGTLDSWHYANDFGELPTLSSTFIDAPSENIERTLAVQNEPQFIADLYMEGDFTRPMPLYSVPGLLDHN